MLSCLTLKKWLFILTYFCFDNYNLQVLYQRRKNNVNHLSILLKTVLWVRSLAPTRQNSCPKKMIKLASANVLRIVSNEITIYHTHTEIHRMTNRAVPDQIIQYKHALMMFKLLRQCTPDNEFVHHNFQANLNQRLQYHTFLKRQNYTVGNNILLNRMCTLNNTIPKDMTNGSYTTYKLKCKELLLKTLKHKLLLGTWKAPYDYCLGMYLLSRQLDKTFKLNFHT